MLERVTRENAVARARVDDGFNRYEALAAMRSNIDVSTELCSQTDSINLTRRRYASFSGLLAEELPPCEK